MTLLDLYYAMPWYIQNILCSIKGLQIKRRRYNRNFYKELESYEKHMYRQDELLNHLVDIIYYIPAYKTALEKISDFSNPYEVIKAFPIINKQYVKEHLSEFINPRCKEPLFIARTSGTTGAGLSFPYTIKAENKQWAVWWRYRRRLGIELNTWCGWFGGQLVVPKNSGTPPYWRINRPAHQVMFDSFHLNNENVNLYAEEIERRKLIWLTGYPSNITHLSHLIILNYIEPLKNVKVITFGAENLTSNQKEIVQRAFPNALLRTHYGLAETNANISQDVNGEYIVDDDYCYVEFIPVSDDNSSLCRIIGTSLTNDAFPLVRYDTGDIATIEKRENGTIRVISIDGRGNSCLKLNDGTRISEASLSILTHDYDHIVESQFYQKDLYHVELRIVKGIDYSQVDEDKLKHSLNTWFKGELDIKIVYLEKIPRTEAGKLKSVISDI